MPRRRPIAQPANANVAAEPRAEEDGVEVAELFDDEIGAPGAGVRGGDGGREAVDDCLFCRGGFPARVVVVKDFKGRVPGGGEGTVVAVREPGCSGYLAVGAFVFGVQVAV